MPVANLILTVPHELQTFTSTVFMGSMTSSSPLGSTVTSQREDLDFQTVLLSSHTEAAVEAITLS